jgi:hypothetical protein
VLLAGVIWRRWNGISGSAEAIDLVDELVRQSMVRWAGGAPVRRVPVAGNLAEFARDYLRANDEFAAVAGRHAITFQERIAQFGQGCGRPAKPRCSPRWTVITTTCFWRWTGSDVWERDERLRVTADLGPYWQCAGATTRGAL